MSTPQTMLIAFDGSAEARRALKYAAGLLAATEVEILTAWEPVHRTAARAVGIAGHHQAEWVADAEQDDPAYLAAHDTCRAGVELATELGLVARAHLVEADTTVWAAICDAAQELNPGVVVTGTRGLGGWKSLWKSSTTAGVLSNADIPVLVVPPESDE